MNLCIKGMGPGTSERVNMFACVCVCKSEYMDDAVDSLAYGRVRVSLYKNVDVYPRVLFVCVLCVCVHMPLSSLGAPSVTGSPPALPRVSPTQRSEPGHSPRRRLRFRLLYWPDPPRTGRDTSPVTRAPAGKAPFPPPGGGNSRDVSVRHAPCPFSLAESLTPDSHSQSGATQASPLGGKYSRGAGWGEWG